MLEIYDLGANSHLFQPILKQIPTSPKIVGIRTGYPHVLISTPCYLDKNGVSLSGEILNVLSMERGFVPQ